MRRVGRPGLIGLAARTAVVTGTANAMQNRAMQNRQEAQLAQQAAAAPLSSQGASEPPAPPAAGADLVAELSKLGELRTAGVLTDEEFAAAKARLLG